MAGLVFLADFFGWTAQEAVEVYIFRSDVQYALNLEPGVTVSTRNVERYQKMFRDDELAISVFQDVTTRLAEKLELDIACQRLDSTHVFSHMASFGRTKLMAVAIKRFLTQVRRHDHELYTPRAWKSSVAAPARRSRNCSPLPRTPNRDNARGGGRLRICCGSSNASPIVPT